MSGSQVYSGDFDEARARGVIAAHAGAELLRRLLQEPAHGAEARVREHHVDPAEGVEGGGDEDDADHED